MPKSAKSLRLRPIGSSAARAFIRQHHYSGKVVNNSQIHLGVFAGRFLVGCLQFGPPLDRRKVIGLVAGTKPGGMLELNRLAFVDHTARNAESRAIAVACRLLRQRYPALEWLLSFADATQCGDGTIYRAAGFILTAIRRNAEIWQSPDGQQRLATSVFKATTPSARAGLLARLLGIRNPGARLNLTATSMQPFRDAGWQPMPGYQIRYTEPEAAHA